MSPDGEPAGLLASPPVRKEWTVMLVWVLFLLAAAVLTAGYLMFRHICVRRGEEDFWDDSVLIRHGYGTLRESVKNGRLFLEQQVMEHITVESDDQLTLHALLVPQSRPRGTVILCHGYRSSWKLDFSCVFRFFYERGYQLLLIDERAHGESEGRFITYGALERYDLRAWVRYLSQRFGAEHAILLHGLSMGATVVLLSSALELPGNVRGIIADCGFTSPYEIIKSVMGRKTPWLPTGPALALVNLFTMAFAGFELKDCSTTEALAETRYPVLLIHGTADNFVPCEMSKENYAACAGEKRLILVEGAGHGMSYLKDPARVEDAVDAFLRDHMP